MLDTLVAPYGDTMMMNKLLGIIPFPRYSMKGLEH